MKYYYQKRENWISAGRAYQCDHPMYSRCTLFQNGSRGLAIIQEKFNPIKKTRQWSSVEPWIAGDIYLNPGFKAYFNAHATEADENNLYPTVKLRTIMWALRMKPLKKEFWEKF
jgi:hypothetical protein